MISNSQIPAHFFHIHFVGIGGIGMSGIAIILKEQGYIVSGCDYNVTQDTVAQLKRRGCTIYEGHCTQGCQNTTIDLVVYIQTYAEHIEMYRQEIYYAQQRNVATVSRAALLAHVMRNYKTIAVAGSHGKTTTSSLIAHMLHEGNQDPTIIIGGVLQNINSNAHLGHSNMLVAEADESDRSLLLLSPTIGVVTNIDLEHLETYRDIHDIKSTFGQFLDGIVEGGYAVICLDDEHLKAIHRHQKRSTITYGFSNHADFWASNINLFPHHATFTLHTPTDTVDNVRLSMAGKHNIQNALGALAAVSTLPIPLSSSMQALTTFAGVKQRFYYHGTFQGAQIFDDYGHHPTEIKETLMAARRCAHKRLIVIFQPHRFTRTHHLFNDFLATFLESSIDLLVITDIYPAFEQPITGITGANLATSLQKKQPTFEVYYESASNNFIAIRQFITTHAQADDLILFLGAGPLNRIAPTLSS